MDLWICPCNYSSKGHTFSLYFSFLKHICFWCCSKHHQPTTTCISHRGKKKSTSFLVFSVRVGCLSLSNLHVFCQEVACSRSWTRHDVTHPWAGRRWGKRGSSLHNQTLFIFLSHLNADVQHGGLVHRTRLTLVNREWHFLVEIAGSEFRWIPARGGNVEAW